MKNLVSRISIKNDILNIAGNKLTIDFNNLDGWMFKLNHYHFRTKKVHVHGNRYYVEISWYQNRTDQLKGENCIDYIWCDYYLMK
jgi:hypothetical protein